MQREHWVNLNAPEIRRALYTILLDVLRTDMNWRSTKLHEEFPWPPRIQHIRFDRKEHRLFIAGESVFYQDRYLHYPRKVDNVYAIYEFLSQFERLLRHDRRRLHDIARNLLNAIEDESIEDE